MHLYNDAVKQNSQDRLRLSQSSIFSFTESCQWRKNCFRNAQHGFVLYIVFPILLQNFTRRIRKCSPRAKRNKSAHACYLCS